MQLRHRFFALVFIIGYIFIAGSLFYLKTEPDLKSKQFRPAFRQESFVEKNETDFRPFIYLTQTERCKTSMPRLKTMKPATAML